MVPIRLIYQYQGASYLFILLFRVSVHVNRVV